MRDNLKLGFYYHCPAINAGEGGMRMPGYLGVFLDALAERCEGIVCFLHQAETSEMEQMDYEIRSRNITWTNLGMRGSVPNRMINARKMTAPIREQRKNIDLLLVRGPTPLLPAVARAAGKTPTALLLVGDYVTGIEDLPQPGWRRKLIRLWAKWNKREQTKAAQQSLTFVNSHKLYEELQTQVPNLVETRTTTLSASDFYEREDTCQELPYHLLYAGRLDRGKGLADLVSAVKLLKEDRFDVVLDIVGWPMPGDPILGEILTQAKEMGISEQVKYHGFKALGEELFACYREADIYMIASRSSEGFPRTIWEAMAHSLPVVATKVGSIPAFIEGAAIIVEPGSPKGLAVGIQRVIEMGNERRELIKHGFKLACANTLDAQADQMIFEMEHWLEARQQ